MPRTFYIPGIIPPNSQARITVRDITIIQIIRGMKALGITSIRIKVSGGM